MMRLPTFFTQRRGSVFEAKRAPDSRSRAFRPIDSRYFRRTRIHRHAAHADRKSKRSADQIGKINTENKSLTDQVNALKTDPKAIERIAREKMGLARPGEFIYKLPDSAKARDSGNPDAGK